MYTVNTEHFVFESGGHIHIRNSEPYQLHVSTPALTGQHFSTSKKSTTPQFNPTDKIPTHKHLYSDQYYHINSIANPHTEKVAN